MPALGVLTGCESMTHTERGAVGGGLLGGTAGALIGSTSGNTGAGAAIGAGLGALSGGLIGNSVEESENRTRAEMAAAAAPAPGQMTLTDVAQLGQQGVSDQVIIGQIRSTHSVFHLTPEQIGWLKQMNVSDAVVMEMQATATRVPVAHPRVYARPVRPVVFVEPLPPPPIGFGFSYIHCR
jgi:outer membrane lipoprotein SlyB